VLSPGGYNKRLAKKHSFYRGADKSLARLPRKSLIKFTS